MVGVFALLSRIDSALEKALEARPYLHRHRALPAVPARSGSYHVHSVLKAAIVFASTGWPGGREYVAR